MLLSPWVRYIAGLMGEHSFMVKSDFFFLCHRPCAATFRCCAGVGRVWFVRVPGADLQPGGSTGSSQKGLQQPG